MEIYRWIKANFYGNGEEVSVRQSEADRGMFFDADGHVYSIDELDFTQIPEEDNILTGKQTLTQEYMQRMNEENERTQNQLREMLSSMDAKAIADHQSEIDEQEYWRKLRGDIFMSILQNGGDFTKESELDWATRQTKRIFNALYAQHQEFYNKC